MPNPSKRMTANPARPVARYRPGKPIAEQDSSDEEEEEESEEEQKQQPRKPQPRPQRPAPAPQAEESEDEDEDGFLTDPEEEEDGTDQPMKSTDGTDKSRPDSSQQSHLRPSDRPPERGTRKDEHDGADSSEEEEDDEESEEEESSSEEEAPRRKFQRPTFIKKSDRKQSHSQTIPPSLGEPDSTTTTQVSGSTPQPSTSEIDEQTRRLAQADLLIKDKLERDIVARAQGKKAWDDDEDLLPENQVDDTDGLDPEAEHAAWKLRELQRLKRDREALIAREKEIEEVDRRRNLTAEERDREDREFLDKQKQERDQGRSDTQYLARYHHKGAFFQGDETAEFLKKRDVMGARFEDQVSDKSVLPEYMRLRDMTKLGKKGRTRYTDLKGQDTGEFGEDVKRWRGSGRGDRFGDGGGGDGAGFDTRGLDDRFLPDDQRGGGGGGTGPTGANASVVKPRRDQDQQSKDRTSERIENRESRHDSRDRDGARDGDRDRDRDRNSHRRESRRSYSQPRSSRSRSPHDPSNSRRKHSRSRSPVARKKRHVDDFRDRDRDRESQRRDRDTVEYRDRSRDRDRDRDRRRG